MTQAMLCPLLKPSQALRSPRAQHRHQRALAHMNTHTRLPGLPAGLLQQAAFVSLAKPQARHSRLLASSGKGTPKSWLWKSSKGAQRHFLSHVVWPED